MNKKHLIALFQSTVCGMHAYMCVRSVALYMYAHYIYVSIHSKLIFDLHESSAFKKNLKNKELYF